MTRKLWHLGGIFTLAVGLTSASTASARPGWTPLPKERQLATFLLQADGWSGIIITPEGKVIAETYTVGHEFPDTGEDREVETLSSQELRTVVEEAKAAATGLIKDAPEQWDWSPVFGGIYHRYSVNQQQTLLKRWGGRDLSFLRPGYKYAKVNESSASGRLVDLLDSLYKKYFE